MPSPNDPQPIETPTEDLVQFTPRIPRELLIAVDQAAERERLSRNEWVRRALAKAVGVAPTPAETPRSPVAFAAAISRLHAAALAGDPQSYQAALVEAQAHVGNEPAALAALAIAQQEAEPRLLARAKTPKKAPSPRKKRTNKANVETPKLPKPQKTRQTKS